MCADLSSGYIVEFACNHLLADWGDKVGKNASIQMAEFVLHHAAAEFVKGLGDLLEIFVVVFYRDGLRTNHIGVDSGHTEAALGELTLFFRLVHNHGVNQIPEKALEIGVAVRDHIPVDYHHPF